VLTGAIEAPFTFRGMTADVTLRLSDWPNAPQLIDGANISTLTWLHTTPRLWQGIEVAVFGEQSRPSCDYDDRSEVGCGGTAGVRGIEVTIADRKPAHETPRDSARWTGIGVYAPDGRMLGTGVAIGGRFVHHLDITNSRGETIFRVADDGTVSVRSRDGRLVPINP
jgi:hypothetical protein